MSNLKDWDTPFGPSSLFEKPKEMTRQKALDKKDAQDNLEWSSFRREAAKDIFCAMMMSGMQDTCRIMAENAITATDELIKKLREGRK